MFPGNTRAVSVLLDELSRTRPVRSGTGKGTVFCGVGRTARISPQRLLTAQARMAPDSTFRTRWNEEVRATTCAVACRLGYLYLHSSTQCLIEAGAGAGEGARGAGGSRGGRVRGAVATPGRVPRDLGRRRLISLVKHQGAHPQRVGAAQGRARPYACAAPRRTSGPAPAARRPRRHRPHSQPYGGGRGASHRSRPTAQSMRRRRLATILGTPISG